MNVELMVALRFLWWFVLYLIECETILQACWVLSRCWCRLAANAGQFECRTGKKLQLICWLTIDTGLLSLSLSENWIRSISLLSYCDLLELHIASCLHCWINMISRQFWIPCVSLRSARSCPSVYCIAINECKHHSCCSVVALLFAGLLYDRSLLCILC